jgi:hypothetical protein
MQKHLKHTRSTIFFEITGSRVYDDGWLARYS